MAKKMEDPIWTALAKGDIKVLVELIDSGKSELNQRNGMGRTLLINAVIDKKTDVVQLKSKI